MANKNDTTILKTKITYLLLCALILGSCSTQKNTWLSRTHHTLNTRYNVYFNGKQSYQDGLANIAKANTDDYSKVLPMYPISNHESAKAGSGQMDKSIEKCRKSIKLHSIKKKPKPNYNKMRDPKYKAFYEQEEFNTALGSAWLLLGKSEFHKGDFIGSVGTFNYIARHYSSDKDMVAQCQLWSARAYGEMGWLYEADDVLRKVNQDELKAKNSALYAAVTADLMLKNKQYKEAIPFLQIAIQAEKKRANRCRLEFVLGQLQTLAGNKRAAEEAYTNVIKANPPTTMDFNARINRTQLAGNSPAALKELQKMAKDYKYKDNLDQIYGAVGNIYLSQGDTLKALENYQTAIERSTQAAMPKAAILVKAADLYYIQQQFAQAQPCYEEASQIISSTEDDYERISRRAETLGELVAEQTKVQLQDSLQHLSTLTEKEQLAIIEKMLADKEAAEKAAAEKMEEQARQQAEGGLTSLNRQNMLGGNMGSTEWYFYNTNLLQNGKKEFVKKWGNRKLEDDWRHASKSIMQTEGATPEENVADSTVTAQGAVQPQEEDTKKPAFYLQQIPKTAADIQASNAEIATALYNMGFIYKDKVEDLPLALQTFEELERRFPTDERLLDVYYVRYLAQLQAGNNAEAERWRLALVNKFPNSKQAQMLATPDYAVRMRRMLAEQDSLYQATYKAYLGSRYNTVFANKIYAEENFPLSPTIPKFLFLNALATAKTADRNAFGDALRDMVKRYPESDVSAMAKDMLALMNQGLENQTGESHGTLLARREEAAQTATQPDMADQQLSEELDTRFVLLLIIPQNAQQLNELLYQTAMYNFSQFMIKDFDLTAMPNFGTTESALKISGFSSFSEAEWYQQKIAADADLSQVMHKLTAQVVPLSETNMALIGTTFSLNDYLNFWQQLMGKVKK